MSKLIERSGDLFSSAADAYGHGVNTAGVMGAGIAAAFRQEWPQMYAEYRAACHHHYLKPGMMMPWQSQLDGRWIYNIASQDEPGPHARLEWVATGIQASVNHAKEHGVRTLALPRIGCGIGGLSWPETMAVIQDSINKTLLNVEVWTL